MRQSTQLDDILIEQLKAKIKFCDEQIDLYTTQRKNAIGMLSSLNVNLDGTITKAQRPRKGKPEKSKRLQIIETVIDLVKRNQRPVSTEEILEKIKENGLHLGKTHERQRAFLGAVLSTEINKNPDSPIMRPQFGTYDVKK